MLHWMGEKKTLSLHEDGMKTIKGRAIDVQNNFLKLLKQMSSLYSSRDFPLQVSKRFGSNAECTF